ncbi:MAG: toll/interleukin-1 receptor domain-containing protein [bacterium]|nr:toll/interleukin-1 receptor domain-containing protein [bacterium]
MMKVTEITRRNILDSLRAQGVLWAGRLGEQEFLSTLWDLQALPSYDHREKNAFEDIGHHRVLNTGDWPDDWIYDDSRFNLIGCDDQKFLDFLCKMIHPITRADTQEVDDLVRLFNEHLALDGVVLADISRISDRPIHAPREVASASKPHQGVFDVFISYAREDNEAAVRAVLRLESRGIRPWYDKRSILPGQDWRHAVRQAVGQCRVFLALMSSRSIDKQGYVQKELRLALGMLDEFPPDSIYLIPARLDDCQPTHERLNAIQWVDLFPDFDSGFDRIFDALQATLGLECEFGDTDAANGYGGRHGAAAEAMDSSGQIRDFVSKYTGTHGKPVPFGGRQAELKTLNEWLSDGSSPPYLLLAAPAGRGKSALLVQWIQQIQHRTDISLVFFPVSIRFHTNLCGTLFAFLVGRLAQMHRERPPRQNPSTEDLRRMLSDYLHRSLPDGRQLLLVLDGIDEGADLDLGPSVFPELPEKLRVVVSARYLANDSGPDGWLNRLGWSDGTAQILGLPPLTRKGIAEALKRMGIPRNASDRRAEIVAELHRLSGGDPLLVKLYVDEMTSRKLTEGGFPLDALRGLQPGLSPFFELWLRYQRELWGPKKPLRDKHVQALLYLLACSLGPLSRGDVLRLIPEDSGMSGLDLDEALRDMERFIIGNGRERGYVFSHSRFADFFQEKMSDRDRKQWSGYYLCYGEQAVEALNRGSLSPSEVSPYLVQYYGVHLENAGADLATMARLAALQSWSVAWARLEGTYSGYLRDIERVRGSARAANALSLEREKQELPCLDVEIRCSLIRSSISSLARGIKEELMFGLVRSGVWTTQQGRAFALHISNPDDQIKSLVAVMKAAARRDEIPRAEDICRCILERLGQEVPGYMKVRALQAIATSLPRSQLLTRVVNHAESIGGKNGAGVLISVAEQVADMAQRDQLLALAFGWTYEMKPEGLYDLEKKAKSLLDIAAAFSDAKIGQQHLLRARLPVTQIRDHSKRCDLLLVIAGRLTDRALKQEVLASALTAAEVVDSSASRLAAVAAQTESKAKREQLFERAVAAALQNVHDRSIDPLIAVGQHMASSQCRSLLMSRAVPYALRIREDYWRAAALIAIGRHLPLPEDQREVFLHAHDAALALAGLNRAHMLLRLAEACGKTEKGCVLGDAIQAAQALSADDRSQTVSFLMKAAEVTVEGEGRKRLIAEAVKGAKTIGDETDRDIACKHGAEASAKMGHYQEAIEFADAIGDMEDRGEACSQIVSALSGQETTPDLLRVGLQAARRIKEDWLKVNALCNIADGATVGEEQRDIYREALALAERIHDWRAQTSALCGCGPRAKGKELTQKVLRQARSAASKVSDKNVRTEAFTQVATSMSQARMYEDALAIARGLPGRDDIAICLAHIARWHDDPAHRSRLHSEALAEAQRLPSYTRVPALAAIAKETEDKAEREGILLQALRTGRKVYYNEYITDSIRARCLMDVLHAAADKGHVSVVVGAALAISGWEWDDDGNRRSWKEMAMQGAGEAIGRIEDVDEAMDASRTLQSAEPFIEIALRQADKAKRRSVLQESTSFVEDLTSFRGDPRVLVLSAADKESRQEKRVAYVSAIEAASKLRYPPWESIMHCVLCTTSCQEGRILVESIPEQDVRAKWKAIIATRFDGEGDRVELLREALDLATKPIGEVLELMMTVPVARWYGSWVSFLERLSAEPRHSLLRGIADLTPLTRRIGIDRTVDRIAIALMDACEWWP